MIAFEDATASFKEPKTARMEHRTTPGVKKTIQDAAALLGVDETTFVTSVALERAREAIAAHERTVLRGRDRDAFFAALEAPAEPSDALLDAVALHRRIVKNDG